MRVVVIEDEQLTADDLIETLLLVDAKIQIIAHLSSVQESLEFFEKKPTVDLIFSDIQLGDGLSFELFKQIDISTPVIFCTAFDEYALNAFKANGIDYILKPYSKKSISEALDHYSSLQNAFSLSKTEFSNSMNELTNVPVNSTILVHHKGNIIPLKIVDIALVYIRNESVYFRTFDNSNYIINKSLDELDQMLGSNFYRANGQFIVNRNAVKDVSTFLTRKYLVNLSIEFSEQIIVSKEKMTSFLKWLKKE